MSSVAEDIGPMLMSGLPTNMKSASCSNSPSGSSTKVDDALSSCISSVALT